MKMDIKNYYKHYRDWEEYLYPNTYVLKNKLNIKDFDTLNIYEYSVTSDISGNLVNNKIENFEDYCNLHYNLFNEIYDWAGEIRTVNMGKGSSYFLNWKKISEYGENLFKDLREKNFFIGYNDNDFFENMAALHFKINDIHPFREGNGRTEKAFMKLIGLKNNKILDYSKINNELINSIDWLYGKNKDEFNRNILLEDMIAIYGQITINREIKGIN